MILPTLTTLVRVRAVRRTVLAAAALTAALTTVAAPAAARTPELPTNALAPQITAQAELAVSAFDEFVESEVLADYLVYAEHRAATARLAARELGYDEFEMIDAWKSATLDHQRAVLASMTQIGVPYRRYASEEGEGFDCSGLTMYAWESAGIELNRVSGDQIRAATPVDADEAMAGDLVHYPGHVMMYLGVDGAIVHARNTGRTVEIETLSDKSANRVTFGDPTT